MAATATTSRPAARASAVGLRADGDDGRVRAGRGERASGGAGHEQRDVGLGHVGPQLDRPVERQEVGGEHVIAPRTLGRREAARVPAGNSSRRPSCVWVEATRSTAQPVRAQRLGRGRADRRDAVRRRRRRRAELVCAVAARDHEPVVAASVDRLVAERLDRISSQRTASCPSASTRATTPRLTRDEYSHLTPQLRAERRRVVARCAARSTIRPPPRRAPSASCRRGARRPGRGSRRRPRDDRALRLDARPRLGIVRGRDELLVARPHLQRERALARLGQHRLRLEAVADLARRARAGRARRRRGRSRRARARRACAAACRCCRAAARSRASARARAAAPSAAPTRCRSASRAAARRRRRARRADRRARRYAPTTSPSGSVDGHVLRGVHGDVDPPVEQRFLELLDEDAARADLAERPRAVAVAGRRDRDERELDARRPQRESGALGLREREPTAAAADADEHSASRLRTGGAQPDAARPDPDEGRRRLQRQRHGPSPA